MRYGFINNFSQILASDLAIGATSMTLDGGGALLSAATVDLVYTLTLDDGNGTTEIVHVTGQTTNTLTIVRAQEGTTAQTWPTGSTVEMRVTAATLASFPILSRPLVAGPGGYNSTSTSSSMLLGLDIGGPNNAADVSVVVGSNCEAGGNNGIIFGHEIYPSTAGVVAAGTGIYTYNSGVFFGNGLNTGSNANVSMLYGVGLGCQSPYGSMFGAMSDINADSSHSAAFGSNIEIGTLSPDSTVAGESATVASGSPAATLYGSYSEASQAGQISIGYMAGGSQVEGGLVVHGLPLLVSSPRDTVSGAANAPPVITRRCSSPVVLQTDALDLTSGTAAVTLDLPTGARLFIDNIDVIITGSNTPGGSPEIQVGPDDVTPAAYLASTLVTKTAVGERQTHTPLVLDGVTSLRVAVSTAGTGTTYQAKVVFRGYVMEL